MIIVGASGSVGRQIVPRLLASKVRLLLIGRDPARLQRLFPDCPSASFDAIAGRRQGYNAVLYLSAVNSDQAASYPDFEQVNVTLAVQACEYAREAGIERFVYFSSTHALDPDNTSNYARSKRAAAEALERVEGITTHIVYMPAVIGAQLSGRMKALNRVPAPFSGAAVSLITALKPTVDVALVSQSMIDLVRDPEVFGRSTILSNCQVGNTAYALSKRVIDLTIAVAILVFLWWAMLIIWALVRLQSPGPGIFRQTRVGYRGRHFTCYKFRTMLVSAPNVATHEAPAAAVTPLGAFLRRTKLDELPQVFNILANQMSLVGPRPCLPAQTDLIEARRARGVLEIKPGITGLGQVNGIDMSDPVLLAQWDERYLKLRSLLLDLKLIIKTGLGKGSGDRVRPSSYDRT